MSVVTLTPLMILVRFLDDLLNQEWLIVKDTQYEGQSAYKAMEVTRLPWNDDLKMWMDAHREEIEAGDVNVFLEYRHRLLLCQSAASPDS